MRGLARRRTMNPPSGRAPRDTASGLAPTSPIRPRLSFSMILRSPRYCRRTHVTTVWPMAAAVRRLLHAMEHAVVAHRENGTTMFNFSEWLGTTSAVVLSNVYHPDNERGFTPAARR